MSYKDQERTWDRKSQQLEQVEACGELIDVLSTHVQSCVSELSKEKQISKVKMEDACLGFKSTLKDIEDKLDKVLDNLYLVSSAGYTQQSSNFETTQKMALIKSTERFLHEELRRMHDKHFACDSEMAELDPVDSSKISFSEFDPERFGEP
ncbi:unnamed protein product, partial [Mesorhabditis belari]|uniref:Mediator complex subunit 11 n=1 Tax=Mesorhabditis belari TaxID=2138241 RepID=A0AAF3E7W7_9BILA